MKLIFDNHVFKSKKECLAFYRNILKSARMGEELTGPSLETMQRHFSLHPNETKRKTWSSEKKIRVGLGKYRERQFQFLRCDGTWESFSYKAPICK